MLAFGGELAGVDLSDLSIGDVHPAPNASHLVVEVTLSNAANASPLEWMERLQHLRPRLRHLLAQSISRKRVPELSFVPVAGGGA